MSHHKVLKVFYSSKDDKWPLKLPPFKFIPFLANASTENINKNYNVLTQEIKHQNNIEKCVSNLE